MQDHFVMALHCDVVTGESGSRELGTENSGHLYPHRLGSERSAGSPGPPERMDELDGKGIVLAFLPAVRRPRKWLYQRRGLRVAHQSSLSSHSCSTKQS